MSTEIKIDKEGLPSLIQQLKNEIETFRHYSKSFVTQTVATLSDRNTNSDFLNSIQHVLNNMSETAAPLLMKQLDQHIEELNKILTSFTQVDDGIAKQINPE